MTPPKVTGRWSMLVKVGQSSPTHVVGIERSDNGTWLAYSGDIHDKYNEHTRSERFSSFAGALEFIGWPVGMVALPKELAKLA